MFGKKNRTAKNPIDRNINAYNVTKKFHTNNMYAGGVALLLGVILVFAPSSLAPNVGVSLGLAGIMIGFLVAGMNYMELRHKVIGKTPVPVTVGSE